MDVMENDHVGYQRPAFSELLGSLLCKSELLHVFGVAQEKMLFRNASVLPLLQWQQTI
jgi:hypothetical protein